MCAVIMNRRDTLKLFAVIISGVWALKVSANGFGLPDQDAFATARGEAFVATADNASAIYYNPAGISQLQGSNLRAGLYGIYLDPTFSPLSGLNNSGSTYHIEDNVAAVPQLFYSHTLETLPLSFGFGVYAPFGGDMTWPQDTGFRTVATKGSLTYFRVNPAVALKLAPNLSIGGGVAVDYAKIDLEGALISAPSSFLGPDFFRFKGDGWGLGYNLGVLWQPHETVSIGATFRSSAALTFEGDTEFRSPPLSPLQRSAQMDLKFPLSAVVGLSYRPTPKWNLEFDADYTDWSSFGKTTIHQSGSDRQQGAVPLDIVETLGWQASWMYEFGVTRYFDHGWHVSAGYVFSETSVPDAYYSPLAADLDRHFFSVGAGHKGRHFDFDVTYQFGYGPAYTVSGSTPSSLAGVVAGQSADGTYDFVSHAVMVTVGLRF
jgi:long-chain fatty acid transport protein